MRFALLFLFFSANALADEIPSCPTSPALGARIAALSELRASEKESPELKAKLREGYGALVHDFPGEPGAHQALIQFLPASELDAEATAYRKDDSLVSAYALAMVTFFNDDKKSAKAQYIALTERAPSFAQPYLRLVRLARFDDDKASAEKYFARFVALCPEAVEPLSEATAFLGKPKLKAMAEKLRAKLAAQSPDKAIEHYRTLWELEFAGSEVKEHDAIRKRIGNDLERLATAPPTLAALSTRLNAYKLLGSDAAARQETEDAILARFPFHYEAEILLDARTKIALTRPTLMSSAEERRAYAKAVLAASDDWLARWSDHSEFWIQRLEAFIDLPDTPWALAKASADKVVAYEEAADHGKFPIPSLRLMAARLYVERGVDKKGAQRLLDAAETTLDRTGKNALASSDKTMLSTLETVAYFRERLLSLQIQLALLNKDGKAAQARLDALSELRKSDKKPSRESQGELAYWRALVLRQTGHVADAVANLLQAKSLLTKDVETRDKAESALVETWKTLGGAADSLALMQPASQPTPEEYWEAVNKALPTFKLSDVHGKTLSKTQLVGKPTFINLWATWCGPCRAELPFVEKLYALAKTKGIRVISFNVDDDVGLVAPFVKEQKLTLPIYLAKQLTDDFMQVRSIPRSWIVDSKGVLVEQLIGFEETATWAEDMLQKLERSK